MLRYSVVVIVGRKRPRAILLAMITMRKNQLMGFLLFPIYGMLMGFRLAALRAAEAPL